MVRVNVERQGYDRCFVPPPGLDDRLRQLPDHEPRAKARAGAQDRFTTRTDGSERG